MRTRPPLAARRARARTRGRARAAAARAGVRRRGGGAWRAWRRGRRPTRSTGARAPGSDGRAMCEKPIVGVKSRRSPPSRARWCHSSSWLLEQRLVELADAVVGLARVEAEHQRCPRRARRRRSGTTALPPPEREFMRHAMASPTGPSPMNWQRPPTPEAPVRASASTPARRKPGRCPGVAVEAADDGAARRPHAEIERDGGEPARVVDHAHARVDPLRRGAPRRRACRPAEAPTTTMTSSLSRRVVLGEQRLDAADEVRLLVAHRHDHRDERLSASAASATSRPPAREILAERQVRLRAPPRRTSGRGSARGRAAPISARPRRDRRAATGSRRRSRRHRRVARGCAARVAHEGADRRQVGGHHGPPEGHELEQLARDVVAELLLVRQRDEADARARDHARHAAERQVELERERAAEQAAASCSRICCCWVCCRCAMTSRQRGSAPRARSSTAVATTLRSV